MKKALQHPHVKALFFSFLGFFLASISDAVLKYIRQSDIPVFEIVAFTNTCSTAVLLLRAAARGSIRRLLPKQPLGPLVRGAFLLATSVANVMAYPHLTLASFYVVAFAAPFLIALFASVFLREKLSLGQFAIIALGFVGVLIGVDLPALLDSRLDFIGVIAAFLATSCWACAQTVTRALGRKERHETIVFVGGAVIATSAWCLAFASEVKPLPLETAGLLFFCSMCGLMAALALVKAMSLAPAATVSGMHYSQFLPGLLFGYLLFGNLPTGNELVGAAIIAVSGLLLLHHSQKTPV